MNGHLRRLPNDCGFINNYHGNIISLKILLYITSLIYENGEIQKELIVPYRNFGFVSNSLRRKGRNFICKYIVDTIDINSKWFIQYADVKFDEKYVYIYFSEKMIDLCHYKESNFYLYDLNMISAFTNINAVKLYLIYKRHRFITVVDGKNTFKCNDERFCSIFQDYKSYTAIRHAIKTAISDFTKVTGIGVKIVKHDYWWLIQYNDNKISSCELSEKDEQELEEALALDDEDDI